jgi:hypothetical protein
VHVEATAERRLRFEDFYRAERATLIGAVVFALGDTDLGIEASDEALVRAHERWTDFAVMSNPMGWVDRVAVNVGYKRTRRLALERRRPLPPDRDVVDLEGMVDPAVTRALAALPFHRRARPPRVRVRCEHRSVAGPHDGVTVPDDRGADDYGPAGPPPPATGQASDPLCAGSEDADLDLGLGRGLDEGQPPPIAVSGVADPRPRPVEVLDPHSPLCVTRRSRWRPVSGCPMRPRRSRRPCAPTSTGTGRPRRWSPPNMPSTARGPNRR